MLSRLKNPKHAVIFSDCIKNVSQVADALECHSMTFLFVSIVSERITYFVLDPIYTVQGKIEMEN